jgi:hypothetical protein
MAGLLSGIVTLCAPAPKVARFAMMADMLIAGQWLYVVDIISAAFGEWCFVGNVLVSTCLRVLGPFLTSFRFPATPERLT